MRALDPRKNASTTIYRIQCKCPQMNYEAERIYNKKPRRTFKANNECFKDEAETAQYF